MTLKIGKGALMIIVKGTCSRWQELGIRHQGDPFVKIVFIVIFSSLFSNHNGGNPHLDDKEKISMEI